VDTTTGLKGAVKDASIVLLCLPLREMRETLARIGPLLIEGAVVFDTSPVKSPVMQWVKDSIPAGRYYVGLVPSVGTSALATVEGGIKAAQADLFRRTIMVITAPPGTPAEVEQLAVNLARLLGAKAMLTDPTESDGIMTTAHTLPQLAATALVEACLAEPGWVEARKVAGRPFAGVTGGAAYYDDPNSLGIAALANRAVVVHALDALMASLRGLRDDIDRGDEDSVSERLAHGLAGREQWLDQRGAAAWLNEGGEPAELPGLGEQVMQMLFGSRIVDRTKIKKDKRGSPL
jgi:prephenate dehydrogenase